MSLTVSTSTLLHASLAYTSPELTAMDSVIAHASPVLPTEILLLIRGWLLPAVTAQLMQRSTRALVAYEHALRDLLCADCVSYNLDIYGPDVWQWDQFTGACACVESAKHAANPLPSPTQYTDSTHWLEAHLARAAAVPDIWAAAAAMLRDYGCAPASDRPAAASRARSHNRLLRRQFHFQRDLVQIMPLPDAHAHVPDRLARLRRAARETGLLLDYADAYAAYGAHLVPASYLRWPGTAARACCRRRGVLALAHGVLALALACLAVPVTFATLAVTVFCFYSRPRGFRVF